MRRKVITVVAIAVIASAVGAWYALREKGPSQAQKAQRIAQGQQLYMANCASCHGDHLQGQPNWKDQGPDGRLPAPPHDATGHTWHHPDQQLFKITKLGVEAVVPNYKSNMAGFGGRLSDTEIWDIIAYIKSTWPPEIQARQQTMTENAAAQGLGPSGAE